jgi:hypothetical protein
MASARGRDQAPKAQPRNDIYVGLLIVSLVAMLIGCVLLFIDYNSYGESKPPSVEVPPVKSAK